MTGGCLCGAVRYRYEGRPLGTSICHCEECQRSTGSAFSTQLAVRTDRLELDGETPATYETIGTDSGERRERRFCAKCGSPVFSVLAELPEMAFIKAGTLDDKSSLRPTMEAWRESAQPWTQRGRFRPALRRGPPAVAMHALHRLLR